MFKPSDCPWNTGYSYLQNLTYLVSRIPADTWCAAVATASSEPQNAREIPSSIKASKNIKEDRCMMMYVKNVKRIFCIFSKNQQFLSHASVIAFVIVTGCLES